MTTETGQVSTPSAATPRIMSSEYLWITIGACALVFLGAFESLAVTTVMPTVSADLGGERLYALAFAGPLATGVIGMVIAGNWVDRRGPVAPLYTAVMMFVVGRGRRCRFHLSGGCPDRRPPHPFRPDIRSFFRHPYARRPEASAGVAVSRGG